MEENLGPQFDEKKGLRATATPGGLVVAPHTYEESEGYRAPLLGVRSGAYKTCCSVVAKLDSNPRLWGEGRTLWEAEGSEYPWATRLDALHAADDRHREEHEKNHGS